MNALPLGWDSRSLSDVCLRPKKSDPVALGRSTIRYIDIGSVDGSRHSVTDVPTLEAASAPTRARQIVRTGDTVFSTVRPYLEKIAYVGVGLDDEFASTGFCVLRPGPRLDARWLFHFSTSRLLLDQVLPHQRGVSYPAVRDKEVLAAEIPLPNIVTQRRIVEILEDHLSRLGAAARSLDVVAYRSRSLLLSQLAREFRPSSGAESTLGAVADWGSGGTPKARTPTFYEGGEIPWVVSGELKDDVLTEVAGRITQEGLKESSAKWVPAGALLVAMYGATIGRLALTTEPVTTKQAVAHALPHQDVVTAEYMFWFLLSQTEIRQ